LPKMLRRCQHALPSQLWSSAALHGRDMPVETAPVASGRLGGLLLAAPAACVPLHCAHQSVITQASADAGQRMRACFACAFSRPRRDLRVSSPDAANSLWRAAGDETCSVAASRLPAVPGAAAAGAGGAARAARIPNGNGTGSKAGAKAAALAAWAGRSAELLGRLRERVVRLLD